MNKTKMCRPILDACFGGVSNILQGGTGDAPQSAMARIRDYYNDLEAVEKGVAL